MFCFKIFLLWKSQWKTLKHAKDTQDRLLFVTLMQATTPPAHPFRIIYNVKDQKTHQIPNYCGVKVEKPGTYYTCPQSRARTIVIDTFI